MKIASGMGQTIVQNSQAVTRSFVTTETRSGTREVTSGEPPETHTVDYTYTVQVTVTETEIIVTTEVVITPDFELDSATQAAIEAEIEAEISAGVLGQIDAQQESVAIRAMAGDEAAIAQLDAFVVETAAPMIARVLGEQPPMTPDGVVDSALALPFLDNVATRIARPTYGLALVSEDELFFADVAPPFVSSDALDADGADGVARQRMLIYAADPTPENWDAYVRSVAVAEAEGVRLTLQNGIAELTTPQDWADLVNAGGVALEAMNVVGGLDTLSVDFLDWRQDAALADPTWASVSLIDIIDDPAALDRFFADAAWGRQYGGVSEGRWDRRLDVVPLNGGGGVELYLDDRLVEPGSPEMEEVMAYARAGGFDGALIDLAYPIAQFEVGGYPESAGNPEAAFLAAVQSGWEVQNQQPIPLPEAPQFEGDAPSNYPALDRFHADVDAYRNEVLAISDAGVMIRDAYSAANDILRDVLTTYPVLTTMDVPALVAAFGNGEPANLRFGVLGGGFVGGTYDGIADASRIDLAATATFVDQVQDRIADVDTLIAAISSDEPTASDLILANDAALNAMLAEAVLTGDPELMAAVEEARALVTEIRTDYESDQRDSAIFDAGLAVVGVVAGLASIPASGGLSLLLLGTSFGAGLMSGGRSVDRYLDAQRLSQYNAGGNLDFSGVDAPSNIAFAIEMTLTAAGLAADAFAIAGVLRSLSAADDLARLGASADDIARLSTYADDLERAALLVGDMGPYLDDVTRTQVARELADAGLSYGDLSQPTRQFLADNLGIVPETFYRGANMPQNPDRLLLVMRERQLRGLTDDQIIANAVGGAYEGFGVSSADDAMQMLGEYYTRGSAAQFSDGIFMMTNMPSQSLRINADTIDGIRGRFVVVRRGSGGTANPVFGNNSAWVLQIPDNATPSQAQALIEGMINAHGGSPNSPLGVWVLNADYATQADVGNLGGLVGPAMTADRPTVVRIVNTNMFWDAIDEPATVAIIDWD